MKKLFKWIGYTLLSLLIIVIATLLFLLNSTKTIEWAAQKYAPEYGFGYTQITGGLLTGLEVKGLTFKDDTLLETFKVGWNPAALLYKRAAVTHLEATQIDVDTVKKVIKAFTPDTPKKKDDTPFVMPVTVGLGTLHISVKPFDESGVGFREVTLDGSGLAYDGEEVDAKDLQLLVDTNITTLELSLSAGDKRVKVKRLSALDIDSIALESVVRTLIEVDAHEKVEEHVDREVDHHKKGHDNLLPESVRIESIVVRVKPAERPEVKINQAEIHLEMIDIDIHDIVAKKSNSIQMKRLSLLVDTNLIKLNTEAKLEKNSIIVDSFSIREIDTEAIIKRIESFEGNRTKDPKEDKRAENQTASATGEDNNMTDNPLIPHYLIVKHLDTSIKSVTYEPVLVKLAEVNATNIKFNIKTLIAESGEIDINAATSFANMMQHAVIKDNHITSKGYVRPLKMLFETYKIPLREDALGDIALDIDADKEKAQVTITVEGEEILQAEEGGFNIHRVYLTNQINYLIPEGKLIVNNEGNISTPYTKNISLTNLLTFEKGILSYSGEINPGVLEGIDANLTQPLNDMKITYQGDEKSIEALIDSEGLEGKFVSLDFKTADFNLSTKAPMILKNMLSLPEKLQEANATFALHVPLDFAKITPLKAKAKISSNIANLDADIVYDKTIKVLTTTAFPKNSLLRDFSKELNLDALNPLLADVTMNESNLSVDVKSQGLTSKVKFNIENKNLDGDLILGGAEFRFVGNVEKEVKLENSVASLQDLIKKIHTIYAFPPPPVDGDMKVSLVLKNMKDLELLLSSNTLTYKADRTTKHIVNDTMVSLGFADGVLQLNKYHTTFQEQKIFATKPSVISLKEGTIEIAPLWVNDELKVTGQYNIQEKQGNILAYADPLNLSHKLIDLKSKVDIKTELEGVKTTVKGTVTILGADVHYNMDQKSFASDSDIIIVQDIKKKEPNPFMDNLLASIKVNTDKPILYKTADANIKAKADILIQKAPMGPLYVLGTAEILKDSVYIFQNKKFVFKKSLIAFTGDAAKPILDIAVVYNSINYEITIQVTGSPVTPNIVLSSLPRLSREEILSVILFDNEDAGGDTNGDEMMKMMGGAMAKSVLSNVGIKIDHLSLGTDGSMEIGKKISDKVTIIYVNEEVAGAKLQYDYSRYIKAVISTDPKSSGADIIYKREFKEFD